MPVRRSLIRTVEVGAELVYERPRPRRDGRGRERKYVTKAVQEELEANEGQWARIIGATTLRASKAVREFAATVPGWEVEIRSHMGVHRCYLRYVGDPPLPEDLPA